MTVCTYFLRGQCKFGDNCRYEHSPDARRQGGFGSQTWANPNRNNNANTTGTDTLPLPFSVNSMTNDLSPQNDKPLWPLSCYGPAKVEPNLLSGLDESPEELRVRAFNATKGGNINEYIAYEADKITAAEHVFANARNNIKQAYEQAAKQSNMLALFEATNQAGTGKAPSGTQSGEGPASAFGTFSTSTVFGAPAFGNTAFGQPAFGQSVFGQATTTATSPFGQSQQPTSAFGQAMAHQPTSAFGQPSQPQSSLIKPASGAFGSLASTNTSNVFGGGGFSAFAGQPSAFGLASGTNTAPSQSGSAFGQSAFGSTHAAPAQPSAFGAPTPGPTSAFNAPAQATTSVFVPSAFGALAQQQPAPVSAFGTAPRHPSASDGVPSGSVFSIPDGTQSTRPTAPTFVNPQPISAFSSQSNAPNPQPMSPAFSSSGLSTFPSMMKLLPSTAGPPNFANMNSTYKPGLTPYDQQLPSNYIHLIPPDTLEAFKSPKFEWGKVPDWIPPLELR